ncbi:DUF2189 domain-containing protein [Methylophaga sp.]|uniref:DUF2189 domain-containing protein n=1 Tax=Methylophaga sp. TaxID=2024840 RepID=UPI003F69B9F7
MSVQNVTHYKIPSQFSIQRVAFLRPFRWLFQGWQDFLAHPGASIAHGLIVTSIFAVALLLTSHHIYVLAAVISGFMLVGPIMAAGLCEISRRKETGETISFDTSLNGLGRNQHALVRFSSILLGFSVLWFALSALVLMATIGNVAPALDQAFWGNFFDHMTPTQLVLYLVVGGLLASMVFVLSVVSVPAIIDSSINALDALFISMKVVATNIPTMLVWAGLIALLAGLGIATFLIGMIVIYPLLGHASWHAYRDLVSKAS